MDLPNEIILEIVKSLDKSDLMSTRLMSKTWCSCASGFLFDEVYVSASREDLGVFEAVTQHPLLSRCVRRLRYDGTEFLVNLTKKGYAQELWRLC